MRFVYGKVKPIRTPADLDAAPQGPEEAPSRKRKLAAILHADVVGFSRLMGEDETGTHQALGRLRRAVDPLIAARGGRIVGTAGDSLLADFPSVVDALNCALDMQRASRAINDPMPPERRLELRIGVNLGDVIIDGDDIFGDGVNIAARIEALAKPGSVCISHTVYEHVKNKLDLDYRPLGSHRVKNIAEPVRAYEVGGAAAAASRPRRRRWRRGCRRRDRCNCFGRSCCVGASRRRRTGPVRVWLRGKAGRRGEPRRTGSPRRASLGGGVAVQEPVGRCRP